MPLPIAIGGKCESAQELPGPCCHPDDLEDGTPLQPHELYQTLAWGVCPKNEWLVRVTTSYYDLVVESTGKREVTMVEVRVQVSFLTRPLSPNYRETTHHLKLFDGTKDDDDDDEDSDNHDDKGKPSDSQQQQQPSLSQRQPQVVVSEDRRNLALLLFHPHQQSSAVVIFQLRIPRSDLAISSPIPLPSYCATTGNDNNASSVFSREAPMIASHPRFVSVWGISTICSIPNASPPILLAVCHDGGLVWLDVRSSLAVASGLLHGIKTNGLPFSSLVVAPTSTMEKGTLLAVSQSKTGRTVLATWKKEKKSNVEQTSFLRRASTGIAVNRKDKSPLLTSSASFQSPSASSRRPPLTSQNNPTRSTPMRSFSAGATPLVQGALNTMLSPEQKNKLSAMFTPTSSPSSVKSSISGKGGAAGGGGDSNRSSLRRHFSGDLPDLRAALFGGNSTKTQQQKQRKQDDKQHMDAFVMKELQKKTEPGNNTLKSKSTATTSTSTDSRRSSTSSSTAAAIAALSSPQSPRKPLRRRRKADNGGGKSTMRSMKLAIVSTLHDNELVDVRFASATIVCAIYKATAKESQKVAQIYSLCEVGSFQPIVTLSLSSEQVNSATDVARSSPASSKRRSSTVTSASPTTNGGGGEKFASRTMSTTTTSVCSRVGCDFDPNSGCFAINTTYDGRWIGLIWNWRCNALGWTIQNSTSIDNNMLLWCRLYFGKHEQQGSHFAYLESTQAKYLQTRKEVVATGLLSPSDSYVTTSIEPCSLLLSGDSISFPDSTQMESGVSELEWKISKIPFMYLNAYGPPEVAAVCRLNGNTLAVASSYGVCILDNKHRWKQFGSPSEEKTFSIVAMAWWEGAHHVNSSASTIVDDELGDLLVAIIQSNNGRQYLSCWSPHRLDLAHQLLETREQYAADQMNGEPQEPSWGIPLTKSVRATNVSLLAEPVEGQNEFGRNNKRRAVVFVSSSDVEACTVDYAIFQLQLTSNDQQVDIRVESYVEQKPYTVVVNPSSQGTIKKPSQSVGPVYSIFLAGASFKFDLLQPDVEEDDDFVGLVGMIRAPGGIEAIALSSKRKSLFSALIDADEVSRVALVDIIHTPPRTFKSQGPTSNCFVWLIELLSGAIFTWSAPYFLIGESVDEFQPASFLRETKIARPKGLRPPTLVRKKESRSSYLLGTLCHVGTSSDWMQQSSSGCQSDISLGTVPRSSFGCVLRAGQTSRNLHRQHVADNFETELFPTDFLNPEVFSPSAFMMTPPSFVSSLYSLFLEAAYLRTEIPVSEASKANTDLSLVDVDCSRLQAIERHVKNRLRASPNEDAVMMALRLLIIRSVEMLTMVNKKHSKEQSDSTQSSLLVAGALFAEIVDIVRLCTTNLQFASLFLEAGRQIEPSCLAALFPLPAPGKSPETALDDDASSSSVDGRLSARTVVELFTLCIGEGSLAASASALPLMGSRIEARNYCDLLLSKSIKAFIDNTHSSLLKFDTSLEERRVIGDIFRYGMKLEDSGRLEEKMLIDEEVSLKEEVSLNIERSMSRDEMTGLNGTLDDPDDVAPLGGSASSMSAETPVNQSGHNLICLGGRQSAILSYLVPSIFDDAPKRKEEEEAIRNAAMSFIETKLEPSNLDFLVQPSEDGINDENGDVPKSVGEYDVQSVGGVVGEVIVNTLVDPKTDNHWKAMASLARLLLQNSGDLNASEVFTRAAEMVQTEELVVLVPEVGYEGEEGLERVVHFVSSEMTKCESNLNEEQARRLVGLVLQLIGRLEDFPLPKANHSFVLSGLLLVGIIAGHAAGRTPLLLANLDDNHVLVRCYEQCCS